MNKIKKSDNQMVLMDEVNCPNCQNDFVEILISRGYRTIMIKCSKCNHVSHYNIDRIGKQDPETKITETDNDLTKRIKDGKLYTLN